MKNRDFVYKGIKFHLNDNYPKPEFEGKYKLLFWHEGYERWQQICTCNSKKEAKQFIDKGYFDIY